MGPRLSANVFNSKFLRRLYVAAAFFVSVGLGALLIYQDEGTRVLQNQKIALGVASAHGHLLQEQINRSLSATYALAAVLRQGDGEVDHFHALGSEMLRLYGGLSAIQLAPAGVISEIEPLAGNEAAMGHNLLADPKRNKEAFDAIRTKRLTLAGPFTLRQGGVAVVGRLPVFLPRRPDSSNPLGEQFWGFTTALIKIDDLLRVSQLSAMDQSQYQYQLSRVHPDTGERDVFAGAANTPLVDPVTYAIEVPNGLWTLSLASIAGWHSSTTTLVVEATLVLLVGLLVASLLRNVLRQPDILRREVDLRTHDLRAANLQLEAEVVERRRAEDALRESEARLERRVIERTEQLSEANLALKAEHAQQAALITQLKAVQDQLMQSEKMASIGVLAAGVAHEINNPIGFLYSNLVTLDQYAKDMLELLAEHEKLDPSVPGWEARMLKIRNMEQAIDLNFIKDDLANLVTESLGGLERVKNIVVSLRNFSHIDAQECWNADDIHAAIDSTLHVIGNAIKDKCEIRKEYGQLPAVECLISQLNQVFLNLLINAAHAIQDKGVITIRTGVRGDSVWVEFSDTGNGIEPEHLKRIFDPFFTTRPVGKGTGLGLSVSYGILEKHHGRIEVESELGRGTTFRLWIPITHAKD